MNALFVIYLIGLIIATFQDFKRREIDNWLNLFLFFSGLGWLFINRDLFNNFLFFNYLVFFGLLFLFCFYFFSHSESNNSQDRDNFLLQIYSRFKILGKRSAGKDEAIYFLHDFVLGFIVPSLIIYLIFVVLSFFFGFEATLSAFPFICFLLIYSVLGMLFFQARVFSGGDIKLFFALAPLFFSIIFMESIINLGIFVFLLFFSGSVYSLFFILFFILKDFKKLLPVFIKNIKRFKIYLFMIALFSLFGFLYRDIFYFAIFFIFIFLLYIVSLSLEGVSLTKKVLAKDLMEGDWIAKKFKFMGRNFDYSWEGLSEKDIKFLKNYDKYIEVKDGIPYALSFLIAFILFYFRDLIIEIL